MSEREAELRLRGLPEWLIRKYLSELGATAAADAPAAPAMHADGWSVSWTRERAEVAGGLALTEFVIVFRGEAHAVADAETAFMKKAQRGGG